MNYIKENANVIKNIFIGGGFGIASGYCYNKYTKASSLGFGIGGIFATQAKNKDKDKLITHLDLDKDGDVDLDDLEIAEERWGINWVGGVSFTGGFGIGYIIGKFY